MTLTDLLSFVSFQILIVYPLGLLVLKFLRIRLWWAQQLIFSLSLGIVILTLLTLCVGYTNYYYLLPWIVLIPFIFLFFQLKSFSFGRFSIKKLFSRSNMLVISAIVVCVLVQSLIVFPNGVKSDGSLNIKGVFTEDAMWHVAIINNLSKSIPPQNPVFAGEKLNNYNYFSDIYISAIQKFTNIETLVLYFKLIGPFLAFLCAATLYFLLREFVQNKLICSLGILLITLSSTYYYVFLLFKSGLNPSSLFGNDYVSRMVNYQLSFSYIIISTFLFLLLSYKKINSLRFSLVAAFLIGSGIGFKSYGAILMIGALFIVGIYKTFKKDFSYIKIAFLSSIFTFILTFLFLKSSQAAEAVFAFNPLWLIRNIFSDTLRLNSPAWVAQKDWYYQNNNYIGVAFLYLKGAAIFLFAQFGLKLLGFLSILNTKESRKKEVIILLVAIAFMGIIMPLTFTQVGVKWNTIQFIWYSSFGLGILFILFISDLEKKIGLNLVVLIMIIAWISFLPGIYHYSKFYLSNIGNLTTYNFVGTQESYQAAKFLSGQPDGILLMDSKYSQTPFIIAISGKNAYFADESILSNLLINWNDRNLELVKYFDNSATEDYQKDFVQKKNISYIFTAKNRFQAKEYLEDIFNNDEISIYKTKL